MKLFLCRHGETEHNAEGIIQGRMDTDLNEKGRNQAEVLAERLSSYSVDHVYTSPLKRAYQTAEIVAEKLDLEVERREEFKEMSRGSFEGSTKEERDERLRSTESEMHIWKPEDGENFPEAKDRAVSGLAKLKNNHHGETVCLVAHGHLNRSLIPGALGYETTHAFKLAQGNVCINTMEWKKELGWILERLNDQAHLERDW